LKDRRLHVVLAVAAAGLACSSRPARSGAEAATGSIVAGHGDDGQPIALRIDSNEPDPRDPEGEVHLYGVSIQAGDGSWGPYCVPDADGRRAAIPVAGSWSESLGRLPDAGADALTFACTSGAIGKCLRFGYKTWKSGDRGRRLGDLHATCVRLVRADYCGNGHGHTVDGTRIDFWDADGIQRREAHSPFQEDFEAGWSPAGATYLNIPRWTDDVAAILRECPERLVHRTSLDVRLGPDQVAAHFPETLMFNNRMHRPEDRMAAHAPH
jgi:hypothetical protein